MQTCPSTIPPLPAPRALTANYRARPPFGLCRLVELPNASTSSLYTHQYGQVFHCQLLFGVHHLAFFSTRAGRAPDCSFRSSPWYLHVPHNIILSSSSRAPPRTPVAMQPNDFDFPLLSSYPFCFDRSLPVSRKADLVAEINRECRITDGNLFTILQQLSQFELEVVLG